MTLALGPGTKIFLAMAPVDMRKGFDGLAAQVQHVLQRDPFSGHLFLFRGRRGDRPTSCIPLFRSRAGEARFLLTNQRADAGAAR